jgi:tetratricopeptide (TPR) repeat protein
MNGFETSYRDAMALVAAGQFQQAEAELEHLRLEESEPSNLDLILLGLTQVYCLRDPPDYAKAEACCLHRERVSQSAFSKYATAMLYYWSMHDAARTLDKLSQAIEQAFKDRDDSTLYSALALKGLALLDDGRLNEAAAVLDKIAAMVRRHSPVPVGDETLFLERLSKSSESPEARTTIRELARALSPVCRDLSFAARLEALART